MGFDVSAEYAQDVLQKSIDASDDTIEQENGSDPNNVLVLENESAFIQGTGYTEEEYYENAIPAIQKTIAINRLREDFVSQLSAEDKNDPAKVEEKYSAYIKILIENADI